MNTQGNQDKGNRIRFGSNRSNNSTCAYRLPSFFTSIPLNPNRNDFLRPTRLNWVFALA